MSLIKAVLEAAANGEELAAKLGTSKKYKHWISINDLRKCPECGKNHGKIWLAGDKKIPSLPIHPSGRCEIKGMETITAGTATVDGAFGADWSIKYNGKLPDYYVTQNRAKECGWKPKKSPSNFIPGKMIGGDVYNNDDNRLPDDVGRIWYEADINYRNGHRNDQRIVWSNDGLVFVSYDHYKTFYEII